MKAFDRLPSWFAPAALSAVVIGYVASKRRPPAQAQSGDIVGVLDTSLREVPDVSLPGFGEDKSHTIAIRIDDLSDLETFGGSVAGYVTSNGALVTVPSASAARGVFPRNAVLSIWRKVQ